MEVGGGHPCKLSGVHLFSDETWREAGRSGCPMRQAKGLGGSTSHRHEWAWRWPALRPGATKPEQRWLLRHGGEGAGTGTWAQGARRGLSGPVQTWLPCPLLPPAPCLGGTQVSSLRIVFRIMTVESNTGPEVRGGAGGCAERRQGFGIQVLSLAGGLCLPGPGPSVGSSSIQPSQAALPPRPLKLAKNSRPGPLGSRNR